MRPLWLLCLLLFSVSAHAELPSATDATIRQALSSGKPVVIDLGARTCIQCKKMAPILEALSREFKGRASVLFIDVHADAGAAKRFGIQMIPTQIFFDAKGKEVGRHIGFMDRPELVKGLQAAGMP